MAPSMAWWGVGHGVVGRSKSLLVPLGVPGVSLGAFLEQFCIISFEDLKLLHRFYGLF